MVGFVVFGVGAVQIQLHHITAGHRAGVGHGHVHLNIAVGVHLAHGEVGPLEGGVGQAVAEGILYSGGVVIVTRVALVQGLVEVAGLVVLVAHVDAFVVEHGGLHVAAVIDHHHVAHVLHGGGGEQVVGEGVHQMAGGVYAAAQYVRNGTAGVAACAGGPQHRRDVGVILHPAQLKGVVGVDHQNHVVEVVVQVLDHAQLYAIRFQVVLVLILFNVGPVAHVAAQVTALAAGAGDEEDGDGAFGFLFGLVGNGGDGSLVDGPVLSATVHDGAAAAGVGAVVVGVELPQGLVHLKTLLQQSGAHVAGDGAHAGAGAAGQQIHRGGREQAQLGAGGHGQTLAVLGVVVEQYKAFRTGFAGEFLLCGLQGFRVSDVAGVVGGIHAVHSAAAGEIRLAENVAQHQIIHRGGDDGKRDRERQQDGQQRREDRGERLRAQFFLLVLCHENPPYKYLLCSRAGQKARLLALLLSPENRPRAREKVGENARRNRRGRLFGPNYNKREHPWQWVFPKLQLFFVYCTFGRLKAGLSGRPG